MVKEHGYSYNDLCEMSPFEYEMNVIILLKHLEKIEEKRK